MKQIYPLIKKYSIFVTIAILVAMYLSFQSNVSTRFDNTRLNYKTKAAINFSSKTKVEDMMEYFLVENYIQDTQDARYVAEQIAKKFKLGEELPNLYSLNTKSWKVDFDSVPQGVFKDRLEQITLSKGWNFIDSVKNNPRIANFRGDGIGTIKVSITKEDSNAGFVKTLFGANMMPADGVIVLLTEHYYNENNTPTDSVLAYCETNSEGEAVFENLDTSRYYSVQPIKKGFDYGFSKGTIGKPLGEYRKSTIETEFTQKNYKVALIDPSVVKLMRDEETATVRTPTEFKSQLTKDFVILIGVWLALFFFLQYKSKKKEIEFDYSLVSILMLLTGLSLLMMFSINDPLADRMLGVDMLGGIVIGVVLIALLSGTDLIKFYQDKNKLSFDIPIEATKWLFKPFKRKVAYLAEILRGKHNFLVKIMAVLLLVVCLPLLVLDLCQLPKLEEKVTPSLEKVPKGFGYMCLALLLTLLLWTPFGSEVGGMKVNLDLLGLKFQPSEIAKYLIVIFMAAFFCKNADKIVQYSAQGKLSRDTLLSKIKVLFWVFVGLLFLLTLYLALGDMGPGLVLAITFILLYSLIKSRVNLKDASEDDKYKRILTCDFAMMIYGIISFVAFLLIGNKLGAMGVFCVLWFVVWIAFWYYRNKQLFESAIFMNLVVAMFIFGGSLLGIVSESSGERFNQRIEMCTNTWGNLGKYENDVESVGYDVLEFDEPKASVNSQVAEGLWGLASGGLFGQGLGEGEPEVIPAFHTDMILESIGEQIGWIGLVLIIILFAMLLRKTLLVGYYTKHSFAFYLCIGIAVVTGVQLIIITLGSTGIIPLTGIVVPFLSYGKTSMILNLVAFGLVLSLSKNKVEKTTSTQKYQNENVEKYRYTISVVSIVYLLVAVFMLGVFFNYQTINRNKTLIRPLFVNTTTGEPVIEYNPRIALLVNKMPIGDIYDRNGVLLATSDKTLLANDSVKNKCIDAGISNKDYSKLQKKRYLRYYPFADDLFFTIGDFNTKHYFWYSENNPIGYMAEVQHLSYLRGFDNTKYYCNEDGDVTDKPVIVESINSDEYYGSRFLGKTDITKSKIVLRDYTPLLPFLKDGLNGDKLKRLQKGEEVDGVKRKNLQLTIDARLQKDLQNILVEYVKNPAYFGEYKANFEGDRWNKLRISVVVLDASNGDMLASANYPKPNQDTIWKHRNEKSYRDSTKDQSWKAYCERDLALTYQTAPGSTAKVMSAMAGLQKMGTSAASKTYFVYPEEIIETANGGEPNNYDVTMRDAIVKSSNCYFVNFVNDNDLYANLSNVYKAVGIRLDQEKPFLSVVPYYLHYKQMADRNLDNWESIISQNREVALQRYRSYVANRFPKPTEKNPNPKPNLQKMSFGNWQWAWGQGTLSASPLNMARVAAIVANDGAMPVTRFVLSDEDGSLVKNPENIRIIPSAENDILKGYMKAQASEKGGFGGNVGGKTGTPERVEYTEVRTNHKTGKKINVKIVKPNDGWYIFFVEGCNIKSNKGTYTAPLAVAVRMERLRYGNSWQAMHITKNAILKSLSANGYLN